MRRELFGKVGDDDGGGLYAEGLKYDSNIDGGDLYGVDRYPVVADHWRRKNEDMTGRPSTPCLWSSVNRYSVMISERARVPAQIGAVLDSIAAAIMRPTFARREYQTVGGGHICITLPGLIAVLRLQ